VDDAITNKELEEKQIGNLARRHKYKAVEERDLPAITAVMLGEIPHLIPQSQKGTFKPKDTTNNDASKVRDQNKGQQKNEKNKVSVQVMRAFNAMPSQLPSPNQVNCTDAQGFCQMYDELKRLLDQKITMDKASTCATPCKMIMDCGATCTVFANKGFLHDLMDEQTYIETGFGRSFAVPLLR
ncbi:MAG: hypothetical protein Q9188_007307, partial [Gyalolechia gomerana]